MLNPERDCFWWHTQCLVKIRIIPEIRMPQVTSLYSMPDQWKIPEHRCTALAITPAGPCPARTGLWVTDVWCRVRNRWLLERVWSVFYTLWRGWKVKFPWDNLVTEVGGSCGLDHRDVAALLHVLVGEGKDWKCETIEHDVSFMCHY